MGKQEILGTLPTLMVEAINVLEELHNAPFEMSLQAVLAIANFATQKHYDVDTLQFDVKPISEFFIALAHSGGAKTTIYKELTAGITKADKESRIRFNEEIKTYDIKQAIYKKREKQISKLQDLDQMELELIELKDNIPVKPVGVKHLIDNPTLNGIVRAFEEVPDVGLLTSEGGVYLNSWGFQDNQRGMEMATNLTKLWDGQGLTKQTGEMQVELHRRRFNMFLMLQQEIAAPLLCNDAYSGQGLLARMLITSVPIHQFPDMDLSEAALEKRQKLRDRLAKFNKCIYYHYSQTPEYENREALELNPKVLGWDDDAKKLLQDWFNQHKTLINSSYSDIQAFAQRSYEHVCRIAGTLAAFDKNERITITNLICAIHLIQMYIDNIQCLKLPTQSTGYRNWKKPIVEKMEEFFNRDEYFIKHGWDIEGIKIGELQRFGPYCFRNLDVGPQHEIMQEMEDLDLVIADYVDLTNGRTSSIYRKFV